METLQGIAQWISVIKAAKFGTVYERALCLNFLIKCDYISEHFLWKQCIWSNNGQILSVKETWMKKKALLPDPRLSLGSSEHVIGSMVGSSVLLIYVI